MELATAAEETVAAFQNGRLEPFQLNALRRLQEAVRAFEGTLPGAGRVVHRGR